MKIPLREGMEKEGRKGEFTTIYLFELKTHVYTAEGCWADTPAATAAAAADLRVQFVDLRDRYAKCEQFRTSFSRQVEPLG